MKRFFSLSVILLCLSVVGCTSLQIGKDFPKEQRQKLIDKFAYFEQNGFGGYYRLHEKIEVTKGKWKGKVIPLFVSNTPAEYPTIIREFQEFPEEWKPKNFEEVDTLVLLEFRGGTEEKLLDQQPSKLKLYMTIIDVKSEKVVRKVLLKTWDSGADRREVLRKLPSIKESLQKKRKK